MSEEEKQRIIAALASSVEEIRYQAARKIQDVFQNPPVEHLVASLGDDSWRVRKCIVDSLVKIDPSPEIIDSLIKALGEEDNAALRNSAAEVLQKYGTPAVFALTQTLKTGDKDERKLAADILGQIGDRQSLDSLLDGLKDIDENVRAACAEACGYLGDPKATENLVGLLENESLLVQMSCLDSLERLGTAHLVPIDIFYSLLSDVPLRPYVYRLLGGLQHQNVVTVLLDGLQSRSRKEKAASARALVHQYRLADKQKKVEIRVAVARIASDEVVESFRELLESSIQEIREAAVYILGWTGRSDVVEDLARVSVDERLRDVVYDSFLSIGPKSVDVLCRLMDQIGRSERVLAVEVLAYFGLSSSLPTLIELCMSDDSDVAEVAQRALGQVGNQDIITALANLMRRQGEQTAYGVIASLCKLGIRFHDEVVAAMRPMLDEQIPGLRAAAAKVICEIARKTDLDEIHTMIGDGDSSIRVAAVCALGRVGGEQAIEKLRLALTDEVPEVRAAVARALGSREWEKIKDILEVALRDDDPWVIKEVLVSLGQSGNPSAADIILGYVGHPNGVIAMEATRSLNRIGWRGELKLLEGAILHSDPEVIKEVLAGCHRWPAQQVRHVLMDALENQHWDVRMAAVKKIGDLKDPISMQAVYERFRQEQDDLVRSTMENVLEMGQRNKLED